MLSSLFQLSSLLSTSSLPAKRVMQTQADCWSFNAHISAETTQNIDLASVIGYPKTQQQLVQGFIDQYTAGSTFLEQVFAAPTTNVSGTYSLYFEYCQPKSGQSIGVFQTHHGLVGNAGYWNVQVDGDTSYSFAESAAAAGWATLSYDRLGSVAIAQNLRAGELGHGVPKFDTVVGVGHSYGSCLLTGLVAGSPEIFDQIILTGFSNNVTTGPLGLTGFQTTIASVAYPDRFNNLANDYVITPTSSNDQIGFFHYPNFTESALDSFTCSKGEYTLGQQNTIAGPFFLDRSGYSKPTFVITGDADTPFCTGDCRVTSLEDGKTQLDTSRDLYPGVAEDDFETYAVPATGHDINFHPTAYDAYQRIIAFVTSHAAAPNDTQLIIS